MFIWQRSIIETDWQWLIRLAWGPRRVSSRAEGVSTYPRTFRAHQALWWRWIRRGVRDRLLGVQYIVIAPHFATARIREKIAEITEVKTPDMPRLSADMVAALTGEMETARANRDFARADQIRAQLTEAGITVQNRKIS